MSGGSGAPRHKRGAPVAASYNLFRRNATRMLGSGVPRTTFQKPTARSYLVEFCFEMDRTPLLFDMGDMRTCDEAEKGIPDGRRA